MIEPHALSPEQRIAAILTDPDEYFASARARAWSVAEAEVDAELALRAGMRRGAHPNGSPPLPDSAR